MQAPAIGRNTADRLWGERGHRLSAAEAERSARLRVASGSRQTAWASCIVARRRQMEGTRENMGDAGEGLIDADARIQERMEELERERASARGKAVRNPEQQQALQSLRLARTDLERQLVLTANERRRTQLGQAMEELDRRIAAVSAQIG